MALKFEMLRVFRAVAETGSLAGAGAVLGRTPSAISMMLSQPEDEIGAPLFETDRKNRLTPLGQAVLDESARATDAFGRSLAAIRRHASSLAGTVRIAAVPSATVTVLPGVVAAFRAARPQVRLEISDGDSQTVRRRVLRDETDIGILSAAAGDETGGIAIHADDLGIVCRPQGAIARQAPPGGAASWALIGQEPLIANPLCQLVDHDAVARALDGCALEARTTTALLSFVRAGLGATILPRSPVGDGVSDLRVVIPKDPPVRRELRKIHSPEARFSPAVQAFWAALQPLSGAP